MPYMIEKKNCIKNNKFTEAELGFLPSCFKFFKDLNLKP